MSERFALVLTLGVLLLFTFTKLFAGEKLLAAFCCNFVKVPFLVLFTLSITNDNLYKNMLTGSVKTQSHTLLISMLLYLIWSIAIIIKKAENSIKKNAMNLK
jgi:hypothetical protein